MRMRDHKTKRAGIDEGGGRRERESKQKAVATMAKKLGGARQTEKVLLAHFWRIRLVIEFLSTCAPREN